MRYFVWQEDVPMPIANQPEEGYTLSQAVARYNREINSLMKLFPNTTRKEIESGYTIRTELRIDKKIRKVTGGEVVL